MFDLICEIDVLGNRYFFELDGSDGYGVLWRGSDGCGMENGECGEDNCENDCRDSGLFVDESGGDGEDEECCAVDTYDWSENGWAERGAGGDPWEAEKEVFAAIELYGGPECSGEKSFYNWAACFVGGKIEDEEEESAEKREQCVEWKSGGLEYEVYPV